MLTASLPRLSLQSRGVVAALYAAAALLCVGLTQSSPTLRAVVFALFAVAVTFRYPAVTLTAFVPFSVISRAYLTGEAGLILPTAIVAVWLAGLATRRWRLDPLFHGAIAGLALLIVISAYSTPSLLGRVGFIEVLMVLAMGAVAASVRPNVTQVVVGIGASGLLAAFAILTGLFSGAVGSTAGADYTRAIALGDNPNELSMLLCLGAVAWAGLTIDKKAPLFALPLLPILAAVPATRSREVFVYAAVGFTVLVLVRHGVKVPIAVAALVMITLVLMPDLPDTLYSNVLGDRAGNATLTYGDEDRVAVAVLAFRTGVGNPLLGVGYNNFPAVAAADRDVGVALNTHNDYLRMFAEAGVMALLGLSAVFACGVWGAYKSRQSVALAILAVYVVVLLISNTLMNIGVSTGIFVLIGSLYGSSRERAGEHRTGATSPAHA